MRRACSTASTGRIPVALGTAAGPAWGSRSSRPSFRPSAARSGTIRRRGAARRSSSGYRSQRVHSPIPAGVQPLRRSCRPSTRSGRRRALSHATETHVKLNRTTIVLPLASLLMIAGAGAVVATSASPSAGTTTTPKADRETILSDVLTNLVADGTINESQKTAILDALAAERTARHAAREAERAQLREFLADGVITQAEIDQLPADSRLRTLTTLLDDGQITTEELQSVGRGFGFGGRGHGHGDGPLGDDD